MNVGMLLPIHPDVFLYKPFFWFDLSFFQKQNNKICPPPPSPPQKKTSSSSNDSKNASYVDFCDCVCMIQLLPKNYMNYHEWLGEDLFSRKERAGDVNVFFGD